MNVSDLMTTPVSTAWYGATLREAARAMRAHGVGVLVLTDGADLPPLGVITDRDIVHMVADGGDPDTTTVQEHVRNSLRTVCVADDVADALRTMRDFGVRRLPVVDNGGLLAGILSFDDLVATLGRQLSDLVAVIDRELEQERTAKTESVVAGKVTA